ncbi:GNAT family N-acetyltransferase [Nocardioides alpinus]|nr:GNAT family N-acetyltransferase [Nocardioides alpinus]
MCNLQILQGWVPEKTQTSAPDHTPSLATSAEGTPHRLTSSLAGRCRASYAPRHGSPAQRRRLAADPDPHGSAGPAGPRDRAHFLDLGSSDAVNFHLGGGKDRAELDAAMPAVPADRPGQFVMEHDGVFVGWMGLGRRDPQRPGGFVADGVDLELSYVAPVSASGLGYAAEAGDAILGWADARLAEPMLVCTQTANLASLRLAARLGFTEVARFEEFGAEQWFGVRQPG